MWGGCVDHIYAVIFWLQVEPSGIVTVCAQV